MTVEDIAITPLWEPYFTHAELLQTGTLRHVMGVTHLGLLRFLRPDAPTSTELSIPLGTNASVPMFTVYGLATLGRHYTRGRFRKFYLCTVLTTGKPGHDTMQQDAMLIPPTRFIRRFRVLPLTTLQTWLCFR